MEPLLTIQQITQNIDHFQQAQAEAKNFFALKITMNGKEWSLNEFLEEAKKTLEDVKTSDHDQLVLLDKLVTKIEVQSNFSSVAKTHSFFFCSNLTNFHHKLKLQIQNIRSETISRMLNGNRNQINNYLKQILKNVVSTIDQSFRAKINEIDTDNLPYDQFVIELFQFLDDQQDAKESSIIKTCCLNYIKVFNQLTAPLETKLREVEATFNQHFLLNPNSTFTNLKKPLKGKLDDFSALYIKLLNFLGDMNNLILDAVRKEGQAKQEAPHDHVGKRLNEGVCLGAVVDYALTKMKPKLPDVGIQPTPQARFIQPHHQLRNIIPQKIQDCALKEYQLREQLQTFNHQLNQALSTSQKWSKEQVVDKLQKVQDSYSALILSGMLEIYEQLEKLSQSPEYKDWNESEAFLPPAILRHLHIDFEQLIGNQGKLISKQQNISEFILEGLPKLVEAIKEEESVHLMLNVNDNIKSLLDNLKNEDKEVIFSMKDLEKNAEALVGQNAPEEVKKSVKAKRALQEITYHLRTSKTSGHALYLSLKPPYSLHDVEFPGLQMRANTLEEFQFLLLAWFTLTPFQNIYSVLRIVST